MNKRVTVIIPVYNAEKWLPRCLNAVCSQSYQDLEIILVDDGSTDQSVDIVNAYKEKDRRVRVIRRKNGGPAVARNSALDVATGEYVLFTDADDRLLPGAIETMVNAIDGCDMVIAHYNLWIQNKTAVKGLQTQDVLLDRNRFLMDLMQQPGSFYYSALWNKLYRRDRIEQYRLRFLPQLKWGEDFDFNMRYYKNVQSVRCIPYVVYDYHWSTKGQTWRTLFELPHNITIKRHLYHVFRNIYKDEGLYHQNRRIINRYIFNVTLFD